MHRSKIEWVRNPDGSLGWVWNPLTGCLNHVNGMCKGGGFPCYAYRLAKGRLRDRYLANNNLAPLIAEGIVPYHTARMLDAIDPFYPRFWPERLYHPWGGEEKGIFVCDMSDFFGIGVPEEWTSKVLNLCRLHNENRYYLLTKQPQNLVKWSPFPDNCWVGVTAIGGEFGWTAAAWIKQIKAKVKFLSVEPFLAPFHNKQETQDFTRAVIEQFDWLIIGAQTKPYKPPKIEWVREIVGAAEKAGTLVFLKDNLRPLFTDWALPDWARFGGERNPSHPLQLRQEMPII